MLFSRYKNVYILNTINLFLRNFYSFLCIILITIIVFRILKKYYAYFFIFIFANLTGFRAYLTIFCEYLHA